MINLTEDLAIRADDNCYILGKPYTYQNKSREVITVLQNPSYHTTITHAIETAIDLILRRQIGAEAITDLRQYRDELKALQENFRALLQESLA